MNKKISELDPNKVRDLIELNFDSRQYFFSKTDERLVDWLWKNGLLDRIKEKTADPMRRSYRMPELDYLNRAADKDPAKVVDIMLAVTSSPSAFNPEAVDRFLWICTKLPAEQLARMIPKIHGENWVKLMAIFNDPGFEYQKMLNILLDAKDYNNILLIAEILLSVRTKDDMKKSNRAWSDDPFYMNNLEHTGVFKALLAVDELHLEKAFNVALNALTQTALLGSTPSEDRIFSIDETYHLFDVDFFTLEAGQEKQISPRDEVREVAAIAKTLIGKLVGNKCKDEALMHRVYTQYILSLPDSRTMWRFKLYFLSICPSSFQAEIKSEVFRLFEYEKPGDLLSGAEYERFLQSCFNVLSEGDQRTYIERVIVWFSKSEWPTAGRDILSSILASLRPHEQEAAEKAFGQLIKNYTPEPSISRSYAGTVISQPPGDDKDWQASVPEIVNHLKTDWTPSALKEKYERVDNFLNPHDATGVADRLKAEIRNRTSDFLKDAPLFFDRENLDSHYTYAFIRCVHELIREGKIADADLANILPLIGKIVDSGHSRPFEKEVPENRKQWGWLAYWDAVHNAISDLLKEVLGGNEKILLNFQDHRNTFLEFIEYLLHYPDPIPTDEEIETAKFKTKSGGVKDYMVGDPFTTAINSVRGSAFQALVNFIYRDAQLIPKNNPVKILDDVKALYTEVLEKENTRAIMFLFGHYLPSFYFRDRDWVRSLLQKIFSVDENRKHFYLAAWEGYLANSLYEEMFFDPAIQKLYERGIAEDKLDDPNRKHFKDPDEGLAVQLGLAFMYYEDFDFDHPLFKAFWASHPERHGEFIDFLGRRFLSGSNTDADQLLEKEPRAVERLKNFWDWMLATYPENKVFAEFGFWINLEKEAFDAVWLAERTRKTLEKTKGFLEWDYGLTRSILKLAQNAPEEVLMIAKLYLLEGGVRSAEQRRMPIHIDDEWFEVFKILYGNPSIKPATYSLIDDLIREGGNPFWRLKEVL